MADVMMVSGLGSAAVAAVGLAAKLHFLLLVIMGGLATGCSVLVAHYSGANMFSRCQRTLAVTLVVGVVLVLPFALLLGVAPEHWLGWVNSYTDVVRMSTKYLRITAPAAIFIQVTFTF